MSNDKHEVERLRQLDRAAKQLLLGLIAVKPSLDSPYPDDPRWTPWTRFIERDFQAVSAALRRAAVVEPE